jgi:TolB protein
MFNGIRKVSLDVERGSAAIDPASVSRGSTPILWLTLSPDGRSLAYTTIGAGDRPGMVREDIVVSATDGSSRRRVAASDSRNRILSWSPSGDRIAFVSDRSGAYRVYTVRADGSDLKSLDHSPDNVLYPVWSPSGDRIAYSVVERPARTLISRFPPDDRAPEALPPLPGKGENFLPTHWSPDGSRIAGYIDRPAGGFGGIVVYNLETRDYENLTDRGLRPRWLADGRHLLYYKVNSRTIFILDAQTRRVREVPLRLDGTFQPWNVAVSKDGRTLFVTETQQEADLWLLDLQ